MQDFQRAVLWSATSTGAPLTVCGPAASDSIDAGLGPATGGSIDTRFAAVGERDYRPALPTSQLIAEIRGLLGTERRAERLVCRYLADLADRVHARQDAELGAYDDEFHAARCCFGLSTRETRERVRVGRALRQLPQIERAFIDGEVAYSRVREVTRVATLDTEPDWLELARALDMRSLERRVAAEREANGTESDGRSEQRADRPMRTEWIGPETVRVTLQLSVETWTLLERAMRQARQARRAGDAGLSDGDALEAVARAALSAPGANASEAGCGAVVSQWTDSDTSEVDTGSGGAELEPSTASRGGDTANRGRAAGELSTKATQGGSAAERGRGKPRDAMELDVCEPGARLMHVMGHKSGWTLDALAEASGLSAREVSVALTLLELGGCVRRRAFAFDPVCRHPSALGDRRWMPTCRQDAGPRDRDRTATDRADADRP